jgi:hypothetical protein
VAACKWCGAGGLAWVKTRGGKWMLARRGGKAHLCRGRAFFIHQAEASPGGPRLLSMRAPAPDLTRLPTSAKVRTGAAGHGGAQRRR